MFSIFAGTTLKMWGKYEDGGRAAEQQNCQGFYCNVESPRRESPDVDLERKDIFIIGEMGGLLVNTHVKDILTVMLGELQNTFKELVSSKGLFTESPVHGRTCKDLRGRVTNDIKLEEKNSWGLYPFEICWGFGGNGDTFAVNRLVMKTLAKVAAAIMKYAYRGRTNGKQDFYTLFIVP